MTSINKKDNKKKKVIDSSDDDADYETEASSGSEWESEDESEEDNDTESEDSDEEDFEESESEEEEDKHNDETKLKKLLKIMTTKYTRKEGEKKIDKKKDKEKDKKEKAKAKKNALKRKQKKRKEESSEDEESDDTESDDDEEYDDEELQSKRSGGIILSIDGFGIQNSDENEHDYKKMKKEDKHEKCDSDDEQMFMKESYKSSELIVLNSESSSSNTTPKKKNDESDKKNHKKNKTKSSKKKNETVSPKEQTVEETYAELVALRKDLSEKLNKKSNNKILQNAIKECKKSISELVQNERNKNTEAYYKLVHQDPKEKKNTNEISYFKKKLSNKEQQRVMKDLKEINAFMDTDKPYRLALLESDIPPKFKAIAMQKLNVLKSMEPTDSEYYKMKNWVDGFMRVPYGIYKNLSVSLNDNGVDECHTFIENAKATLDDCTYGLNDAKMQILQMVGQWIANPSAIGTAIAIKGPPGTGKTTLVKEGISKILGREFAFIALGGTSDASFLEGHSYTYEGSTWGKIVSILMESKCMNPVIYFDELDKISDTPKGEEIASILTHLTDTSQNSQFHDKYFTEVDFDMSKCLFIFSYNDESKVNPILKDRMYSIQTKGYDAKEKIIIARKHLLPKIREQVNFQEGDIVIPDKTLEYIIGNSEFCKEEKGVRNLKRCLEIIHTKLNLFRLVKPGVNIFEQDMKLDVKFPFTVDKQHVDVMIKSNDPTNHQSMFSMYV